MKLIRVFGLAVRALVIGGLTFALSACGNEALLSNLDETQANEVVAALRMAGIPADKVAVESHFVVTTASTQFGPAVQLLQSMGLPRKQFDSMGKVFKREGFVSSPLEERARLLHATSEELNHTLSSIDGVVLARVTLAVPEKHPLSDKVAPASAGVFIKHRPGLDVASLEPKIKALVVNSVEGMPYEGVTVVALATERWPMGPLAAASAMEQLQTPLVAASLVGVLSFFAAGGLWWRRRQVNTTALIEQNQGRQHDLPPPHSISALRREEH